MKTRANGVLPMEPEDAPMNSGTAIVADDNLWYWIGRGAGWIGKLFTNSTRNVYNDRTLINAA